jgi:site-specific DNA-methyltransferase (cytosine-N4-specific)
VNGATLHCGDVRHVLAGLPEQSVQCVVTSPPYWGLRDYADLEPVTRATRSGRAAQVYLAIPARGSE